MTKQVGGEATRDDPPVADDWGLVVRPLGSGPGGATVVIEVPAANSDLQPIAASISPVVLLTPNPDRLGFTIRNTSDTDTLYVKASAAGGPVTNLYHTVALGPHAYYEDPYRYIGEVSGVWGPAATGEALVDEYLP